MMKFPLRATPFLFSIILIVFLVGFSRGSDYRKLHSDAIVADLHNDVLQRVLAGEDISHRTEHGQSDLPRWKEGGVDIEFFSVWVPPESHLKSYFQQADLQIDAAHRFVSVNSANVAFATTADQVEKGVGQGKFVVMLGMEGAHPIGADISSLEHFYKRGVRYLTLTWNNSTAWASSAQDESNSHAHLNHRGLTDLGKRFIRKMNDLGMLVDVSHAGEKTFWDVMKTTRKPIIASHSSAWALCHNRRNLKDEQLRAIGDNGGVIFINFAPWFIDSTFASKEKAMLAQNKTRIDSFRSSLKGISAFIKDQRVAEFLHEEYLTIRPPLKVLIDHIDYVARLVGPDHVGIGSDFDGITVTPLEMDDVSYFPNITRELLRRGYSDTDIRKILGENLLRVLRENEPH